MIGIISPFYRYYMAMVHTIGMTINMVHIHSSLRRDRYGPIAVYPIGDLQCHRVPQL